MRRDPRGSASGADRPPRAPFGPPPGLGPPTPGTPSRPSPRRRAAPPPPPRSAPPRDGAARPRRTPPGSRGAAADATAGGAAARSGPPRQGGAPGPAASTDPPRRRCPCRRSPRTGTSPSSCPRVKSRALRCRRRRPSSAVPSVAPARSAVYRPAAHRLPGSRKSTSAARSADGTKHASDFLTGRSLVPIMCDSSEVDTSLTYPKNCCFVLI